VASTSTANAAAAAAVASTLALSPACRWDLWENFWTAGEARVLPLNGV